MSQPVPSAFARLPRALRWLTIAALALALLWGLAWRVVPPLVKWQAEQRLSALLSREVTIGRVDFAPWSLALTVEQLRIGAAAGAENQAALFSVERVHVNADLRSLLRLAPVIEALDVEGPKLHLTRLADGRYDIDDLLVRLARNQPPPADDKPARFALYNLRLAGGSVEFDDRPVQRVHRVQGLQLSLPFLSNLPADVAVTVEPRLAFTLDGAAFDSDAQARPFAQDRASQLELRIAGLDLAPWLPYLPAGLPLRPSRGVFASQLQVQFTQAPGAAPRVALTGQATLRDVALVTAAGEPLAAWKQLQVGLADVQPLLRRVSLGAVTLDGAQLELRRAADGHLNLLPTSSATTASPPKAAAASAAATTPARSDDGWRISAEQITVASARIDWRDAATQPAAALRVDGLDLSVQKLRWPVEAPAPLKLSGRLAALPASEAAASSDGARFTLQGQASDRTA